jgi:glutathione-regulated potassium-efflux system ancillary protein KefF
MPFPTLILHAHPQPRHSVVTRNLLEALTQAPAVASRQLYDLYPDFDIDVAAEQQALVQASLIIWLAPVHWYGVPALLKHWIDQVLLQGWAYGKGGDALRGKTLWWVCSAGAPESDYAAGGAFMRPFEDFVPPLEQTALYCGMNWLPPFVVFGGHSTTPERRAAQADELGLALAQHRKALAAQAEALTP